MPGKNQGRLSSAMQAVLLLLVVIIGIQVWYMLGLKKQLDAIQAEYVFIQQTAQAVAEKNEEAVAAIDTPATPVDKTEPVQEEQAVQKIPPENKNTAPAIQPALPNGSPLNSPYYSQTRDPYEEFRRMQRHMDRALNNRQNYNKRPDFEYHFRQDLSVPEMDVREDNEQYIILVNIPGSDEKNISVRLDRQRLTVSGKQTQQKQDRDASGRFTFSERLSGRFKRGITLHAAVEENGMRTRIDNGVLTIIIPKKK